MNYVSLQSISEAINYGLSATAVDKDTGVKFLRITDIGPDGVDWEHVPYCKCSASDMTRYRLASGDLVFARTGATTGKSYLVERPPASAVFASYLIRVRPEKKAVLPSFLSYFFRSAGYWRQIEGSAVGAAQLGVNASKLASVAVPLPNIAEQSQIAALLGKAERLLRQSRYASQLSDTFLRSVFLQMFGPTMSEASGGRRLSEFVTITGGGTPSREIRSYYQGTIPWLTSKDMRGDYIYDTQEHITSEAINESATKLVPAGSILVVVKSKVLMHTLPVAIARRPLCHGQDIKSILCSDKMDPHFLVYLLKHYEPKLLFLARGANTEGLTLPMLRDLPVPEISITKQRQFSEVVKRFDRLRVHQREAERQAEHLFHALLQRAFAGEL